MKQYRELILQVYEIENTAEAFRVALNMMTSLRDEFITIDQYEHLAWMLEEYCRTEKIETKEGNISLF